MKQIIQNYKTGELSIIEAPIPKVRPGGVLIKTLHSVISIGSERMVINFSKKSLLGKALSRPDLVRQVINRAKKEGWKSTFHHAMNRLDTPLPLGYSSSGVVVEVGDGLSEFQVGDLVACNGTGYASHAEYSFVPFNLAAKVPEGVNSEEAAFTTLGAIALQGIRNTKRSPGSVIAVFGLGLIGLLTVQILKSYRFIVIGVDIDEEKLKLAENYGTNLTLHPSDSLVQSVMDYTDGLGVDAVIIAAATKSNLPIKQAAEISRYRGRVVMVGVTHMEIPRKPYYERELELIVSRSTGPGKHDPVYEIDGIDYPPGLVRWTQKRNMQEVLRLMAEKCLQVNSLITHRISIDDAVRFYEDAYRGKAGKVIGAVIEYPESKSSIKRRIEICKKKTQSERKEKFSVGLIGAGLFGKNVLYPKLKKYRGFEICGIATLTGVSAIDAGKKFEAEYVTTDYHELLKDKNIDAVFITTRHSSHARIVMASLEAGKSIFVEKPLATNRGDLEEIRQIYESKNVHLMVGFCRRYSPAALDMELFLSKKLAPKIIIYRVNAGHIPGDHWVQREEGGRIVGEVCHFIDFICFLTKSPPKSVYATSIAGQGNYAFNDNLIITLNMEDGSIGNIIYCANGDKAFSREYVEVYCAGSVCINNDFKEVITYNDGKRKKTKYGKRDLGYANEIDFFFKLLKGKVNTTFEQDYLSTLTTFYILDSLKKGQKLNISSLQSSNI